MGLILYCNKNKVIGARVVKDLQTSNPDHEYLSVNSVNDAVNAMFSRTDLEMIITARNLKDGEFAWEIADEVIDISTSYSGPVIYADRTICPRQKVAKFTQIFHHEDHELLMVQLSEYIEKEDWKD
ncbi:MAG: hypothetical protein ABIH82_05955 [Candidatus Woesearchaeota archaeon]